MIELSILNLPTKPAIQIKPGDFVFDDNETQRMVTAVSSVISCDCVTVSFQNFPVRKYRIDDRVRWLPRST